MNHAHFAIFAVCFWLVGGVADAPSFIQAGISSLPRPTPTVYVYSLSKSTCIGMDLNHAWEPHSLALVKSVLTVTQDPRRADFYLVDACLSNFYVAMRDSANPATRAHVAKHNAKGSCRAGPSLAVPRSARYATSWSESS